MKLLVATSNEGKLVEIRQILAGVALELVSLRDAGVPAPEETGDTFHDNAAQKATTCARQSGLWWCLVSMWLWGDALVGPPGVHSARYAPTDSERRSKLLAALEGIPQPRRVAHFFCAVALSAPDGGRVLRAEGRVDGSIALAPRGAHGFGYDPLFLPAQTPGKTLAELGAEEKNRLSHRGRALQDLRAPLERLARGGAI